MDFKPDFGPFSPVTPGEVSEGLIDLRCSKRKRGDERNAATCNVHVVVVFSSFFFIITRMSSWCGIGLYLKSTYVVNYDRVIIKSKPPLH